MVHWIERWHGQRLSTYAMAFNPGSGGSTAASTGIVEALSSKADLGHSHAPGDVTGLASTLAGLAAQISTKAAGVHAHTTSDVTGLDAALSTKAGLANGIVPDAQLGSGIPTPSVFLRGDRAWAAPTAAASGVIPSTWVTASTHVLTGSTVMQPVTGLSFAVSSASVYRFEFALTWLSSALTTGIAFGVNGPAAPTALAYEWGASTGLGPMVTRAGRAFGVQTLPVAAVDSTGGTQYGYIDGLVRTGATAGTLQAQFASEVAGSTVSVRAGSVGFLFGPL